MSRRRASFPLHLLPLLALAVLLPVGCGEVRSGDHELSAEEQVLMARLTRDPFVVVDSWSRDADGYVVVTTFQGNARSRYLFKPDRPGDRLLNIHHIEDRSLLESPEPDRIGTGPHTDRSGRSR